ncbi:glycosyl transferase family protein [Mycolicibacterium aurum]|uniref:Glycosyl transferase family protein n=1 Tax=Mycolicibacterium aurum TaxID=1791 RepID=A0A448IQD1_MYCAU|nr:glycosyltransferase [Mycolicibacterium aurum]VEG54639.1 glycosyl transferase family protein [Mycolicibacterium aurum]
MRFAVAVHGTRGDVEPCAAVAAELMRRGHHVRMAVPPNLVSFVEGAGLGPAVPYGVDSQEQLEADVFREPFRLRHPVTALRELREYMVAGWAQMSNALVPLAGEADLILTGTTYQELAANVAEQQGIPLAALHYFPFRANTHILPVTLPGPVIRSVWPVVESLHWRVIRPAEDAQRRALGLPRARSRAIRRMVDGGALEIQAYDPVFFPGLAEQWAGRRPLTGALTLRLDTGTDEATSAWIDAGSAPIYFGFGSMPVESPAAAVGLISDACAELGERALICSGVWDITGVAPPDHVRVVQSVNHAAVFPRCRAVVHHGGAGTTAAGLRAGAPTFVLWIGAEQPIWAAQVKRLGVGTAQRFSSVTAESLRAGLRAVLAPACVRRAGAAAARMITADQSVSTAADLLEASARQGRIAVRVSPR